MTNTATATTDDRAKPLAQHAVTHFAYHVRDGKDKGVWTRVGVAWLHRDGRGLNVRLDCLPLDGRLALRVAAEATE